MIKSHSRLCVGSPSRIAAHWSDDPDHAIVLEDLVTGRQARIGLDALASLANAGQEDDKPLEEATEAGLEEYRAYVNGGEL